MFAAIAVISFAVDQTITLSSGASDDPGKHSPPGIERVCTGFSPAQLIQSLIGAGSGRSNCAE